MERAKLINVISDELSIDKSTIFDNTNLNLLCILSDYLNSLSEIEKNKIKINKDALNEHTPIKHKLDKGRVSIGVTFLFENISSKRIMYNSISGRDGFLEYEMILLTLHFKIEDIFNIRIPFEQLISFYTVKQILSYIEEENINNNNNNNNNNNITSNNNRYVYRI